MSDEFERVTELIASLRDGVEAEDIEALQVLVEADDADTRREAVKAVEVLAAQDLDRALDQLPLVLDRLDDQNWQVRSTTARLLKGLAEARGEEIADAAPALAEHLDDESGSVTSLSLEALQYIATENPTAVEPFVDQLVPFLDETSPQRSKYAVIALAAVSTEHSSSIDVGTVGLVDKFVDGASHESIPTQQGSNEITRQFESDSFKRHRDVRQAAGHALYELAGTNSDALVEHLDRIIDQLEDEDVQVRDAAIDIAMRLADATPAELEPHVDAFARRLHDESDSVSGRAVQTLARLSVEYPAHVRSAVEDDPAVLQSMLDREDPPVRAAAASLLALLAETDASVIDPVSDRLVEMRDGDEAEYVQQSAADALGASE